MAKKDENSFWGQWFGTSPNSVAYKSSNAFALPGLKADELGSGTKKEGRKGILDHFTPYNVALRNKENPLEAIKQLTASPFTLPGNIINSIFGSSEGPPQPDMNAAFEQNKRNYWNMFLTQNANLSTQGSTKELSTALSEGVPRLRLGNPGLAEQLSGRIETILTARAQPGRRQTILANPLQRL